MNLPVMKLSSKQVALRIRENQWDQLSIAIDDLVMNREYPLDVSEFLKCLQASLTKRQGLIDEFSQEHRNIQQNVNILDAFILCVDCTYESAGVATRTEKLAKLKSTITNLEVVP